MSDHKFDPEVTTIVRRFSEKVAKEMPEDPIAQALGTWEEGESARENEGAAWQHWLQFSEQSSDPDSALLEQQCRKVAEIWRDFKSHFPGLEWTDSIDRPPSIMALQEQVVSAQKDLETRSEHGWRRVKNNFSRFLESLEGHKALFSVIPEGNMYTSLLVGVVSSVVKASVAYGKTAQGFSEALADLSSDLHYVGKSTGISDSPEMKRCVVKLYAEVFEFLCHAMKWYQSPGRRLLKSLNANFYDDSVQKRVTKIQRLVQQVNREANLKTQMRVMDFAENQRRHGDEVRMQFEALDRKFGRMYDFLLDLGMNSANLLQANGEAIKDEERKALILGSTNVALGQSDPALDQLPDSDQLENNSLIENTEEMRLTRDEMCEYSERLKEFAEYLPSQLSAVSDAPRRPYIPEEVVRSLRVWIEAGDSRFLWVEGPGEDSQNEDLSRMATQIWTSSSAARIPVVLFFRRSHYSFQARFSMSVQQAGLIALLYSLITQFINLLPEDFPGPSKLARDKFERLDGSFASIDAALEILDSLLGLAPPALVCVINGLERLESRETMVGIALLVNMLRRQSGGRRFKILFTTLGSSYVLGKKMDIRERVLATRMNQGRAGSFLPGAASIGDVRIGYMD
ncbi:Vacuolar protein sorting-associated protein atg6 [Hypoxylon texense]